MLLAKNHDIKLSFNDSKMIVSGSLGKLANAWINKADDDNLKSLLKLFYPTQNLDELLEISSKKQIFPYRALSTMNVSISKSLIVKCFMITSTMRTSTMMITTPIWTHQSV
jgi:hypothetical protein